MSAPVKDHVPDTKDEAATGRAARGCTADRGITSLFKKILAKSAHSRYEGST
jgi:hypothetical protein